jgi:hypothetical protein
VPRIVRIIAFGLGLAGGVVASQAPEFSQQYRQRLGGTIDELRRVIGRFDADAGASGETRDSAIARLRGNADALASRQGTSMQGNLDRMTRLEGQRQAMMQAGPFARIGLMASGADREVMQAAYVDFEPAVPVTQEGLVSAAAGFVAVWGGILLLAGLLRRRRRPRGHPVTT